jgi:hypothetical protein
MMLIPLCTVSFDVQTRYPRTKPGQNLVAYSVSDFRQLVGRDLFPALAAQDYYLVAYMHRVIPDIDQALIHAYASGDRITASSQQHMAS